jgi:hypothetical protein
MSVALITGAAHGQGRAVALALAEVRDDEAVSAAVGDAIERFGRIDVLFNNAGICAYGLAHELTEAEWAGLAAMEGLTPREVAERSAGNLLPVPWVETRDVAEAVRFLVSDRALHDRDRVRDRRGAAHALKPIALAAASTLRRCAGFIRISGGFPAHLGAASLDAASEP